jgi:regulatory protein
LPVVTSVRERRGRVRVSVDGEPYAELDAEVAARRGLREGAELSREELEEARLAGERPLAMERALNALSYRARSAGELRTRLLRSGFAPATVGSVLDRLGELGYLDDREFARNLARGRARRGYGPRKAYADLRRGGVGEEVARGAVDEAFSDGADTAAEDPANGETSELAVAREAARRRYNREQRSDAVARRVYGFLSRRGFSGEVCAEVAREFRR